MPEYPPTHLPTYHPGPPLCGRRTLKRRRGKKRKCHEHIREEKRRRNGIITEKKKNWRGGVGDAHGTERSDKGWNRMGYYKARVAGCDTYMRASDAARVKDGKEEEEEEEKKKTKTPPLCVRWCRTLRHCVTLRCVYSSDPTTVFLLRHGLSLRRLRRSRTPGP